ncbi:MAG: type II toxin-antitoxin system VapC family toxin [Anaerolineales bacterium]|jgi:predicted nucleic acid-binding protein
MTTIVVDANLTLSYVIPLPYSQLAVTRFTQWGLIHARLIVPALWRYEVLSGLRKAISLNLLTLEQAIKAFRTLQELNLEETPTSNNNTSDILDWATRLQQVVAYDAVYIALSEQIGAEFWTANRRLFKAARQAGASWVHSLEEA